MRKVSLISFVVFAVLLIGASPASSQDRNRISGFVFDETRQPVGDIYVELQNDFYTTLSRTRTSGSGMYNFAGLPSGRYVIKVLGMGTNYDDQSVSVSLIPISVVEGRGVMHEQVDFYLRPRKRRDVPTKAAGVVYAQDVPSNAQNLYKEGLEDLENKKDAEGLDKIKRSIEAFPDYYLALDTLGNAYLARKHYEAAYILLEKALSVNSRSFSSTLGLGLAAFRLGRNDDALSRFQSAVNLDRGSINAHLWLGIAQHATGDMDRAMASLREARKIGGEGIPEIHWQLARVLKDQEKFTEAAKELRLFLKYRPDAANKEQIEETIRALEQKS